MKEKLITHFEMLERYMLRTESRESRWTFFSQCFGALEFAMSLTDDADAEQELIDLWNLEWRERLVNLVYGLEG